MNDVVSNNILLPFACNRRQLEKNKLFAKIRRAPIDTVKADIIVKNIFFMKSPQLCFYKFTLDLY